MFVFCFQLLENHIKSEVIEKTQLVQAISNFEENKVSLSEPRGSASIACGATVFEVSMKVPLWASQVFTIFTYSPLSFLFLFDTKTDCLFIYFLRF